MNYRRNLIQRIAYELWETAGRPTGKDKEFWSQAESTLPRCPIHKKLMWFEDTYAFSGGFCANHWYCAERGCRQQHLARNSEEAQWENRKLIRELRS